MSISIEDFWKSAKESQKEIILKISELYEKEKRLEEKIKGISYSKEYGIFMDDYSLTVCEDEDDTAIIYLRLKKELKKVRAELKDCMKTAVKCNMEKLDFIQKNYEKYVGKPLSRE